jgi:Fur family ferric uptake transcriptional regulator
MSDLKAKLSDGSGKLPEQRQAVLNILTENSDKHLSADEIHRMLAQKETGIGIATVYRTLILLEKLNLIRRIDLDDGCSRYQICKDDGRHEHHHMICQRCGKVEDFPDDLLDDLEIQVLQQFGFVVYDHRVKLYGLCRDCAGQNAWTHE